MELKSTVLVKKLKKGPIEKLSNFERLPTDNKN